MSDYFAMGGYAAFIWPSYALAVVLLIGVFGVAARRLEAATRARVSSRTFLSPLKTRLTVIGDTPACRATWRMVAPLPPRRLLFWVKSRAPSALD